MPHAMWLKPVLIACTVVAIGLAGNVAVPRAGERDGPPPGIGPAPESAVLALANADSLARVIAAHDPFRAARLPASVRFDPEAGAPGALPPPVVQRPTFSLAGVMMGAEPTALVDGLPGTEGTRVLRVGERVGDYVVREIGRDRVVIAGRDTTWTLRVRTRFQ